jgi:hypothetical protein
MGPTKSIAIMTYDLKKAYLLPWRPTFQLFSPPGRPAERPGTGRRVEVGIRR